MPETMFRSEIEDPAGRATVQTRLFDDSTWETTVMLGDTPDLESPQAAVFAIEDDYDRALTAHQQAVSFAVDALRSTARRYG
jgi:hypothetical protein